MIILSDNFTVRHHRKCIRNRASDHPSDKRIDISSLERLRTLRETMLRILKAKLRSMLRNGTTPYTLSTSFIFAFQVALALRSARTHVVVDLR